MEIRSLSEIACLSTGEYSKCIKLYDTVDKCFGKVIVYKQANPDISLLLAREQVQYSWFHFIRAIYFDTEENNIHEQRRQLGETEKHLKKAIVAAFEAPLREMINFFEYMEVSYPIPIQDTIPNYIDFKNFKAQAEDLLNKHGSSNTNNSYHDHQLYEELFDSVSEGVLSLKSASKELEKRTKQEKMKNIGILAALIAAIATLIKFSIELCNLIF